MEEGPNMEHFGALFVELRGRAKELGLEVKDGQPNLDNQVGEKGREIFEKTKKFLDDLEKEFAELIANKSKEFEEVTKEMYR